MKPTSINSPANRRIVEALEKHGELTQRELAEAACVSLRTVQSCDRYLPALVEANRIHIARWTRGDGNRAAYPLPIYAAGPGTNAPKPRPLSRSQREARYRKTAKYATTITCRTARKHGLAAVAPALAALMGVSR